MNIENMLMNLCLWRNAYETARNSRTDDKIADTYRIEIDRMNAIEMLLLSFQDLGVDFK